MDPHVGRARTVLVAGATGFLGSRIAQTLARAGYRVVRGARQRPQATRELYVVVDFASDVTDAAWERALEGVDVVVNAIGIAAERPGSSFDAVHDAGPRAMFRACVARGVDVVQVSALGADAEAQSRFHRSKRAADDELLAIHPTAVVVQPSLVFGPGGTSATMFAALASLPVVPLPGDGRQRVQPIHVDDLADAIVAIVGGRRPARRLALVGPQPVELRELLSALRARMDLPAAIFVEIPMPLARAGVRVAAAVRPGWLSTELLDMLERGNTASAADTIDVLGHAPRGVGDLVEGERERIVATRVWLAPLLRIAIAAMWLVAAAVSLGLYPLEESVALVERTGLHGAMALAAVYAGAGVDAAFGIASLLRASRALWLAQIVVIVAYTAILTLAIPETWLHPFGPLAKNVPILVAILVLYRWSPR